MPRLAHYLTWQELQEPEAPEELQEHHKERREELQEARRKERHRDGHSSSTLSHYVLRARSYVVIINTLFYKGILR